MTEYEVQRTGETVTMGRRDAGAGVTVEVVTIGGYTFAEYHGKYGEQCGMDSPEWSGTKTHFLHRHAGTCYQCNGTGRYGPWRTEAEAVRLVKGRAAAERRRVRKEEARLAQQEADLMQWQAEHPEVVTALAAIAAELPLVGDEGEEAYYDARRAADAKWGGFVVDLALQAEHRPLTEGQTATVMPAVEEAMAEQAERAAREEAARWYGDVNGKVTGSGTVVVAMTIDGYYGASRLVVVEGGKGFEGVTFKMFGTGKTLWETGRGDTVEVSGTVKDHETYEGVKQTVLTRAKIKVLTTEEQS